MKHSDTFLFRRIRRLYAKNTGRLHKENMTANYVKNMIEKYGIFC